MTDIKTGEWRQERLLDGALAAGEMGGGVEGHDGEAQSWGLETSCRIQEFVYLRW